MVQAWRAAETPQVARENIYLLRDRDNPLLQPQVALTHGGMFNRTETLLSSYLGRVSADYSQRFGEHDIKLFGFAEIRSADRESNPFQGYGIQYDRGNQVYFNPLIFRKLSEDRASYFSLSRRYDRGLTFSTSATYGYAGKYIFNTVLNYEGSNASGRDSRNQWLPTWNVGAKWNIDREPFAHSLRHVSKLALKLSVTNPLLIYSDARLRGQDTEYYQSGGVSLPTPRQCILTLSLGL